MSLEEKVLTILSRQEKNAFEIAEEIDIDIGKVTEVLQRLKAAGLLIEMEG